MIRLAAGEDMSKECCVFFFFYRFLKRKNERKETRPLFLSSERKRKNI